MSLQCLGIIINVFQMANTTPTSMRRRNGSASNCQSFISEYGRLCMPLAGDLDSTNFQVWIRWETMGPKRSRHCLF